MVYTIFEEERNMKRIKKIAIDLDMVLVTHIPYFRSLFKKYGVPFVYPTSWGFDNYPWEIRNEIFTAYNDKDCKIVTSFPIIRGAIETLDRLKSLGWYLEIVTSRAYTPYNEEYIKKNFPMVDKITLLESGIRHNKHNYIQGNHFDVWIDDYPIGYGLVDKCKTILISNYQTPYNHHYMRYGLEHIKSIANIFDIL
jgi:hypothetical protein